MRNKASLVLMEQLVMLLVFALAAAACLGIFAGAHRISQSALRQDAAVELVQNGAEILKSNSGDFRKTAEILSAAQQNNALTLRCEDGYRLHIEKVDSPIPGLGQAAVWAVHEAAPEEILFSIRVSWQEVD